MECYVCHTINTHTKPVKGKRICGRCAMAIRKDRRLAKQQEEERVQAVVEALLKK